MKRTFLLSIITIITLMILILLILSNLKTNRFIIDNFAVIIGAICLLILVSAYGLARYLAFEVR